MTARLLVVTLPLPLAAIAGEVSDGERIFDAKCSQCHTFRMARGLLATMSPVKRPEHLIEFLKTHPPKPNDREKKLVIEARSRPDR
jgi:mono/diheme cytochrome c family protein